MGELIAGRYTYGLPVIRRGQSNKVKIGAFCSIAEGVIFDGGFQHNMKFVSTYPFPTYFNNCGHLTGHVTCKGDITIGNDVWIGEGVCIMGGVTIGDGAVIGFRSIISKDVQPYEIVAGAPQKVIRKRFTDEQIKILLEIRWWDWGELQIQKAAHLLMSENIDELYNYFKTHVI